MKFAWGVASLVAPAQSNDAWIWPLPQSMSSQGSVLPVAKEFKFNGATGSDILSNAAGRYEGYISANATSDVNALQSCSVSVGGTSERLVANTSYKYSLKLSGGSCNIIADTVFGAMYGMESLYQLAANGTLPSSDIDIEDFPDFDHRGVMIDTGRRFFPVSLVKDVIDVMSFNKMNVLHLHASDMCRFGVESKLFPELTKSLDGIKAGHYTQEDVVGLVAYGRDRGVRIIPEFDMPGHAACFIPMEPRGVEVCNRPGESGIPNWCALKAWNGTATWDLMPQLALEMAQLFGSEIYHIGGDETSGCAHAGPFEGMLLETLTEAGFRTMGWSEIEGSRQNDTIIHSWNGGSGNATSLAARGIASVDSAPYKFYRGDGKTMPAVTNSWADLDRASIPKENQHLLLGGEFAFWTDAYCYINDCVRPGSSIGGAAALFGPDKDEEFSRSAGGMLWPYGHLAAGSFWKYDETIDKEEIRQRATRRQNTLASWRGGNVCPTDCECTMTSVCKESLVPAPSPSPAPSSHDCQWKSDTVLDGKDLKSVVLQSKEECCAACRDADGCAASNFDPLSRICHLKQEVGTMTWINNGFLACIPTTTTTTSQTIMQVV